MGQEQLAGEFRELLTLVTGLRQERSELRFRIRLARCGIQHEWEKAENKWQSLQAENDRPLNTAMQQARELKDIYIRIYRGLLVKNSNLLDQLSGLQQKANIGALEPLKRRRWKK